MTHPLYLVSVLLITSLVNPTEVAATGDAYQSLPAIHAVVEEYFRTTRPHAEPATTTVGRLDPRLRLAACDAPLQASQNPGARPLGPTSVNVRCEGSNPWSIFVPAHLGEQRQVVVAARALTPGRLIGPEDVASQTVWISDPAAQYVEDAALVIGKQIQRMVAAGAPLSLTGLRSPRAIRRGAAVTLALERGPIAVRMTGVALQDGAVGDRIQARNNASRRIVEGVIGQDGIVVVR